MSDIVESEPRLLPSETICNVCFYTYHKALPECPTCKELR